MLKGMAAIRDEELTLSRVPGHICKLVSNGVPSQGAVALQQLLSSDLG